MIETNDQPSMVNGVNVTALGETVGAINGEPTIAKFQFRAANRWLDGGHNRSTIKGFYGAGQEDTSRTEAFVFDADEPPVLLGEDSGANPVEYLLHALAGCVTTTMVYHAASRGIEIRALSSELEGDIDIRGFMGLSEEVPKGYQAIRVRFRVETDAAPETLKELAQMSPVFNSVNGSVPVTIEIETV
jgi:uncharacterized OsmC-like protein